MRNRAAIFRANLVALFLCQLLVATASPTPPVDFAHARTTFDAGGGLTYDEVVALRHDIVGDPPDSSSYNGDLDKYYEAERQFEAREALFAEKLAHSKLKDTVGWVAGWRHEYDKDYKDIADKNRVSIYLYDPFHGYGKDLYGYAEMFAGYFTDKEVSQLKYGQRIKFSGDLLLPYGNAAVQNATLTPLDDDPVTSAPTADELKDLRINLDRTACLGPCPDYTLTIAADGTVTFDGRYYTKVKGAANAKIDGATLVELAAAIKQADFFGLGWFYHEDVTDSPTYQLAVQMGGHDKQVYCYVACPRRLFLLLNRIDQIVNTAQWIGDERNP